MELHISLLEEQVRQIHADDDLRTAAIVGRIGDPRLPTDIGGYGYRITDGPNPNCPECAGLGVGFVRITDTTTLTGSARLLYDGVEETRQGKRIKIRDRDRALENLAKHLV